VSFKFERAVNSTVLLPQTPGKTGRGHHAPG
jgi:hypothetical protein